ncbi:MAG: hypothetical protein HY905_18305 [Deltaproteobacteria bacterium]|nr:hypothetical protein [Deltaproteobacteria bacterium]
MNSGRPQRALLAFVLVGSGAVLALLLGRGAASSDRTGQMAEAAPDAGSTMDQELARRLNTLSTRLAVLSAAQSDLAARHQAIEANGALATVATTRPTPPKQPPEDEEYAAADGGSAADGFPTAKLSPAEELAEIHACESRLVARREEQLAEEPSDPRWSWGMERDIGQSLAAPAMGAPRLSHLRCGTTMCGVSMSFSDANAVQRFSEGARTSEPWTSVGELMLHRDSYEDVDVEVYIARQGHAFRPAFDVPGDQPAGHER